MACDISLGRKEPCKSNQGGLKAVYFVNNGDATGYTYDSVNTDVIETVTGTPTAYKYELKGASNFEQTINSDRNTGTTFFTQTLNLSLKTLTPTAHKELKLLTYGLFQVIVEDNMGNKFLAGLTRGAEVTGGSIMTGTNLGDQSGYTLTIVAEEPVPANFLDGTLTAVGYTVVEGV
jgi:hypothetical protein